MGSGVLGLALAYNPDVVWSRSVMLARTVHSLPSEVEIRLLRFRRFRV